MQNIEDEYEEEYRDKAIRRIEKRQGKFDWTDDGHKELLKKEIAYIKLKAEIARKIRFKATTAINRLYAKCVYDVGEHLASLRNDFIENIDDDTFESWLKDSFTCMSVGGVNSLTVYLRCSSPDAIYGSYYKIHPLLLNALSELPDDIRGDFKWACKRAEADISITEKDIANRVSDEGFSIPDVVHVDATFKSKNGKHKPTKHFKMRKYGYRLNVYEAISAADRNHNCPLHTPSATLPDVIPNVKAPRFTKPTLNLSIKNLMNLSSADAKKIEDVFELIKQRVARCSFRIGQIMYEARCKLGKDSPEWQEILENLNPLVIAPDAYYFYHKMHDKEGAHLSLSPTTVRKLSDESITVEMSDVLYEEKDLYRCERLGKQYFRELKRYVEEERKKKNRAAKLALREERKKAKLAQANPRKKRSAVDVPIAMVSPPLSLTCTA
ncbi:MAG: hypothetical protein HQK96_10760 [Nitrospirae bacterium]|nr:hypothetical protein [Nitrospirota bacterium]